MYNSSLIAFSYDRFFHVDQGGEGEGWKGEKDKGFRNKGHPDRGVFVERTTANDAFARRGKNGEAFSLTTVRESRNLYYIVGWGRWR